jgi:fatty-acyl-CoA synthase
MALRFDGVAADLRRVASAQPAMGRLAARTGRAPGDRIAWLGLNHPDQLRCCLPLARVGAVLVPLNFRLAPPEWDAVLADCTPRCVIHDGAWADAAQDLALRHGLAAHGWLRRTATPARALACRRLTPRCRCCWSTPRAPPARPRRGAHPGQPAGQHGHCRRVQGMTPADTVATVLPLFHVGGLCIQTLPALYAGAW